MLNNAHNAKYLPSPSPSPSITLVNMSACSDDATRGVHTVASDHINATKHSRPLPPSWEPAQLPTIWNITYMRNSNNKKT